MTTEEYLRTRVGDNDLAEPFLKCLEHQRKLEIQNVELRTAFDEMARAYHNSSSDRRHDSSFEDCSASTCAKAQRILTPTAKPPCGRCGNILRGPHDEATCDYGNV